MKRNVLLLTAVVLAAVMLSGCVLWPFGKVNITVDASSEIKAMFKASDLKDQAKKNSPDYKLKLTFAEAKDEFDKTEYTWESKVGSKAATTIPADNVTVIEDTTTSKYTAVEIKLPVVKDDITVIIKVAP